MLGECLKERYGGTALSLYRKEERVEILVERWGIRDEAKHSVPEA